MKSAPAPPDDQSTARRRFQDRVRDERRSRKKLGAHDWQFLADAVDVLLLSTHARLDGTFRGPRDGPKSWWDEKQLTAFMGWDSTRTFFAFWQRLKERGWVTDERPNRGRMQRRLCPERTSSV